MIRSVPREYENAKTVIGGMPVPWEDSDNTWFVLVLRRPTEYDPEEGCATCRKFVRMYVEQVARVKEWPTIRVLGTACVACFVDRADVSMWMEKYDELAQFVQDVELYAIQVEIEG